MNQPTERLQALARLPLAELEALLEKGSPGDPAALVGYEYAGVNVGVPGPLAGVFRKFRKAFFRHEPTGRFGGWNIRCVQNEVSAPWIDAPRSSRPKSGLAALAHHAVDWATGLRGEDAAHGYFEVYAADDREKLGCGPGPLIIDYRRGGNPPGDVTALLRDLAVCVYPGDPQLLIGRAYLDVSVKVLSTPSVFLLERAGPIRDQRPVTSRRWFA